MFDGLGVCVPRFCVIRGGLGDLGGGDCRCWLRKEIELEVLEEQLQIGVGLATYGPSRWLKLSRH